MTKIVRASLGLPTCGRVPSFEIPNLFFVLVIVYWNLRFICNLVLEVWNFIGSPYYTTQQFRQASARRTSPLKIFLTLGKADGEGRARAHLALHVDIGLVFPDDSIHHRESETDPLALLLGGEEWLEDYGKVLLGNAAASVTNVDVDHTVLPLERGVQGQFTPIGHRLHGVENHVHNALLDLIVIPSYLGQFGIKLFLDGNVLELHPVLAKKNY